MKKSDNFLKDEIQARNDRVKYIDGFRFGFGFFIAWLLGSVLVAIIVYLLSFIIHPH